MYITTVDVTRLCRRAKGPNANLGNTKLQRHRMRRLDAWTVHVACGMRYVGLRFTVQRCSTAAFGLTDGSSSGAPRLATEELTTPGRLEGGERGQPA
jgi:hypothetical protein